MSVINTVEIRDEILSRRPGLKLAFRLLYAATKPEDLNDFHNKCDGKGPTLTVLYGIYDVVFGGYTSKDWMGKKQRKPTADSDAFLFVQKKNTKCQILNLSLKYRDRAITCYRNYGPTFGGGHLCWQGYDLQTFEIGSESKSEMKGENLVLNGRMNLNCAYKSEDSTFSSENVNGGILEVRKIEVYQVVDYIWREKPEDTEINSERKYLENIVMLKDGKLPYYNILLIGNVGVGKSSFVNTLVTAMSGEIRRSAQTGSDQSSRSVTNQFTDYILLTADNKDIKVKVFDTRGLSQQTTFSNELKPILMGQLKPGYTFPDKGGKAKPPDQLHAQTTIKDRMHLVCLVVDVMKFDLAQSDRQSQSNQKLVMDTTHELGIPVVCVATQTDQLCPMVRENVDNIYQSLTVSKTVKAIFKKIGIEERDVFPVVNYVNDTQISDAKNSLAIHTLYSMIRRIEDSLRHRPDAPTEGLRRLEGSPNASNSEHGFGSDTI